MINLNLKWAKNANQLHLGLCDGCKYLCVNSDGVVFKLVYNKDNNWFVSPSGKTYKLGDFIEFSDGSIEG